MAKGITEYGYDVTYNLIGTKQVSVTPAAVKISDGGFGVARVKLQNMSTNITIYVSGDSSMATTNGYPIIGGGSELLPYGGEIWGMVQTTTSNIGVLTYMGRTST